MVHEQVHRGEPVFAAPGGPGPDDRRGRIDQRSIQVEDDRLKDLIGQFAQTHRLLLTQLPPGHLGLTVQSPRIIQLMTDHPLLLRNSLVE